MTNSTSKLAVFAFLLTAACATTDRDRAMATKHGLMDTKTGVDTMVKQTDALEESMKKILDCGSGKGDAQGAYAEFTTRLAALESTASDTRSRVESMEGSGEAYFRKWEEEMGT